MSGPTLTMAPAVNAAPSPSTFHLSHSSPDPLDYSPPLSTTTTLSAAAALAHPSFHRHTTKSAVSTLTGLSTSPSTAKTTTVTTATTESPVTPSTSWNSKTTPSSPTADANSRSTKSLPSLPAFDVPSFDFDVSVDLDLSLVQKQKRLSKESASPASPRRVWEQFAKEDDSIVEDEPRASTPVATEQVERSDKTVDTGPDDDAGSGTTTNANTDTDTLTSTDANELPACSSRGRTSLVDRLDIALPVSHSTPNVHDLIPTGRHKGRERSQGKADKAEPKEEARQVHATEDWYAINPPTQTSTGDKMVERSRAMSVSFVDFARRSWKSRSPSPSSSPSPPPSKKLAASAARKAEAKDGKEDSGRFVAKFSRKRSVPTVVVIGSNGTAVDSGELPDAKAATQTTRPATSSGFGRNEGASADFDTRSVFSLSRSATNETTSAMASGAAAAPSSKTFSRASGYLTRLKQRPQSIFLRASQSSPVLASGSLHIPDVSSMPSSLSRESVVIDHNDCTGPDADISNNAQHDKNHDSDACTDTSLVALTSSALHADDGLPALERSSLQTTASSARCSSSEGSLANGSTAPAASESESLTTNDTGNHSMPNAHGASRDPLWLAFKDLETSFFKFLSKTNTAQRVIVVRAALIPFLRRYARHGSNENTKVLSPEDIERRASIFNRWWNALLELLDGPPNHWQSERADPNSNMFSAVSGVSSFFATSSTAGGHFQTLPGVDRPVVLEAVAMIMARPEWRLLTAAYRPLVDRSPDERVRARSDTSDSSSPSPDDTSFQVEESAEHNIRTMFVTNLLAQLYLVVDKMAMRHAPLSVVNFSGRACAYAFYFVPGVADILVRLWSLDKRVELIRRAADALGLPRRSRGESEDLAALFPPGISSLSWSSVTTMHAKLRRPPRMSIVAAATLNAGSRIPWLAPGWLSRWRGSDSDLLFVFAKYYHILADDFMPATLNLPLVEKARAPGFVLLHAQLLGILDSTIHRQAAVEAAMMANSFTPPDAGPQPWSHQRQPQQPQQPQQQQQQFTAASANADAFMPPVMMQPNHNLFREMDENRMIALLRNMLEAANTTPGARDTFAETVMALLKAAAYRTSQYDHSACYLLCDFLQEVLRVFDDYYGYSGKGDSNVRNGLIDGGNISGSTGPTALTEHIDWTFWLDVCKMMLNSNNTMSEIRVLSFVYSAWGIVAADPGRKEALCMGWLLTEEVFDKFFNNWCPMVRAYYMRLLCWCLCRDCGSPNELDTAIFLLVSQRLKTVWAHYMWLKQKAEVEGTPMPSTAPSLPQPGKRFMIVRTEVNAPQLGLLANNGGGGGANSNNAQTVTGFDVLSNLFVGPNGEHGEGGNGNGSGLSSSGSSILSYGSSIDERKGDGSGKKKWSLLGKVLSLTTSSSTSSLSSLASSSSTGRLSTNDEYSHLRRNTAASKSFPTSLRVSSARPSRLRSPSSDSDSSTGSVPVFDAAQFVFKFMLHNIPWQGLGVASTATGGGMMPPPAFRERVLTRPRLPAPAQARVSARMYASGKRTESPPPPAAGLPPATRRVSGAPGGGLVNDARNADDNDNGGSSSSVDEDGNKADNQERAERPAERQAERQPEQWTNIVQPLEPNGPTGYLRAKYAGRALAEWSQVVSECNSFVDRRRDEGVFGLSEVEVPSLGIDGMRRMS